MAELQHKTTSVTMTFLSDQYPKGKKYIFNNVVEGISTDKISVLKDAVSNLIEGHNSNTEVHNTEELIEE